MKRAVLSLMVILAAAAAACDDPTTVPTDAPMARAGEATCRPIEGPGTISEPGFWCLARDIELSGPRVAIRISSSNVTLDLGDHSIRCTGCSTNERAVGIEVDAVSNVLVRDGSISGFYQGVLVQDPAGAGEGYSKLASDSLDAPTSVVIEHLKILQSGFRGIRADGRCMRIQGNTISDTRLPVPGNHFVMGIEVYGPGAIVEGNVVFDTHGTGAGEGVGVAVSDFGSGSVVRGNRISNAARSDQGDYGIWVGGATSARIMDNFITNFLHGIAFSSSTSGFYGGNAVANADVPYLVSSDSVVRAGDSFETAMREPRAVLTPAR